MWPKISFLELKMFKTLSLVLLLVTAVAVAQEDCPNPSTDCPDSCEGEQCPRFLNAECRVNPCHGLCTPNFFWRGSNVTDRCPVRRCSDRVCPSTRECIEEIRPPTCPEGLPQSQCRQYINTQCILPPISTDCSQISCGAGQYCRQVRPGGRVRCAIARNCDQLECEEGSICTETEQGPQCTL